MKFLFITFLFFSALLLHDNRSLALSDYQIKVKCQKKKEKSLCIKNLQYKRSQLLKGNRIEIPVIRFKK